MCFKFCFSLSGREESLPTKWHVRSCKEFSNPLRDYGFKVIQCKTATGYKLVLFASGVVAK